MIKEPEKLFYKGVPSINPMGIIFPTPYTKGTKPTEDVPSKNLNNSYSDEEVNDDESKMMKSEDLMQAIRGQHTKGLQT